MVRYGLKHAMSSSFPKLSVTQVAGVEIRVEPWSWPFATAQRQEIDAYFTDLKRRRAALWNGRVLMLNSYSVSNGVFTGTAFETDYANLCAWRDWAFPDQTVFNFFAPAAIRTCDGAYVLGKMAPYTAGAGKITFPSGTPEPGDIIDGSVDLMGNMRREVAEETGLTLDELECEVGWSVVRDRSSLVLVKRFSSSQLGDELLARIKSYLENETQPEFSDVRIVRSPATFHPRMEPFTLAFLDYETRRGLSA
jgi:8-oxo-dGTP pyrophosphatase MutT (NUDIX family)